MGRVDYPKNVRLDGAVTAAKGQYKSAILQPDNDNAAAADTERWISEVGCMAFRFTPLSDGVAGLTGLVFGWSTIYDDMSNVNSLMAQLAGQIATPTGNMTNNTGLILPTIEGAWGGNHAMWYGAIDWIFWDGESYIRTIALRSVGADYDQGVLLELVTVE